MSIKSITFSNIKNHKGYLFEPNVKSILRKGKTYEEYENALKLSNSERYKLYGYDLYDYFFYERKSGYKNLLAQKCLCGKTIEFSIDKVNIIFGPNASGKSTIINTIAKSALCGSGTYFDGLTNLMKYSPQFGKNVYNIDDIKECITNDAKNIYDIEWDGNPVYYHNFFNRYNRGTIDDLTNSILGGLSANLTYLMNKSKMNSASRTLYIFDHLYKIAQENISTNTLIDNTHKFMKKECNDIWQSIYNAQIDYIKSYYNTNTPQQNTILIDELDHNLDILNIAELYTQYIPQLQKISNQQIILVSHSPLILSETICNPNQYNIISLDKIYTNNIKKFLKNIKF